ncbi:MAG: hypothetical protein GY722_17570 [bacterium]|nr:hypothetical protein [bacterium]
MRTRNVRNVLVAITVFSALLLQGTWADCPDDLEDCGECQLWERVWNSPTCAEEECTIGPNQDEDDPPLNERFPVGQIFRIFGTGSNTLHRIDVMMNNGGEQNPLKVSLVEWPGGTVVLWEENVLLTGPREFRVVSFYPGVTVTGGSKYLIKFESFIQPPPPNFGMTLRGVLRNAYIPGQKWPVEQTDKDMWFKVYLGDPTCAANSLPLGTCTSGTTQHDLPEPDLELTDFAGEFLSLLNGAGPDPDDPLKPDDPFALPFEFVVHEACNQPDFTVLADKMDEAVVWLNANPDNLDEFHFIEAMGWAYKWHRDSLRESTVENVDGALLAWAEHWEPKFERSMTNRALIQSLGFGLVRDSLCTGSGKCLSSTPPEGCNCTHWQDLADEVYEDFTLIQRDLAEDATHYSTLAWRYLLQWIIFDEEHDGVGTDIWTEPWFQDLVRRYYQYHSPVGPAPIFGDSYGWNQDWATLTWLFAEAGAKLDNPDYTWLASRIFDFQNRANSPLNIANQTEWAAICHAWKDLKDESVPPALDPPDDVAITSMTTHSDPNHSIITRLETAQTFEATETPLARLDIRVRATLKSPQDAVLRLYKWDGLYVTTLNGPVIFEEEFDVPVNATELDTVSFYPLLELEVGETYLWVVDSESPVAPPESPSEPHSVGKSTGNPYLPGHAFLDGALRPSFDLLFHAYTLGNEGSLITERKKGKLGQPTAFVNQSVSGNEITTTESGQTFVATANTLFRFDITAKTTDPDPGNDTRIQIFKWNTDYDTTLLGEGPIMRPFGGQFDFPTEFETMTFEVNQPLEKGQKYLIALDSLEALHGIRVTTGDEYAEGETYYHDGSDIVETPSDQLFAVYGEPAKQYELLNEKIPDKLILRSGYSPSDLHVVVNLLPDTAEYSHAHMETGAILSVTKADSILLSGSSRIDNLPEHDSRLLGRYFGCTTCSTTDSFFPTREPVEVDLVDGRRTSIATIGWVDPSGRDIRHTRRLFFVKNPGIVLVRDKTEMGTDIDGAAGPIWHASNVADVHGTDWYNLYEAEPQGREWDYKNNEQYLLLRTFDPLSDPEYRSAECQDALSDPMDGLKRPSTPRFTLTQQWLGNSGTGTNRWFETLLLPNDSSYAGDIAGTIDPHLDDEATGLFAFSVTIEGKDWTFIVNPAMGWVEPVGVGVGTDAEYLIVRHGLLSEGGYIFASNATKVEVDGVTLVDSSARTSVETPFQPCPRVLSCTVGIGECYSPPEPVCTDEDLGLDGCLREDLTILNCPVGTTVHEMECDCEGSGICRTSQRFACM